MWKTFIRLTGNFHDMRIGSLFTPTIHRMCPYLIILHFQEDKNIKSEKTASVFQIFSIIIHK